MFRMLPWLVLGLAFLGTARCYTADLTAAVGAVPFVGPIVVPPDPQPAYLQAMGTPAPLDLPGSDPAGWFPAEGGWQAIAPADWAAMLAWATAGATPSGWKEVCARASAAAGADRAAAPLPGALACSDSVTVTGLQRVALELFGLRAALGLWLSGAPGGSPGAVQARQAQVRLLCATTVAGRLAEPAFSEACAGALDPAYLAGDGAASMAAFEAAYGRLAGALATLDPTVDPEPASFAPAGP